MTDGKDNGEQVSCKDCEMFTLCEPFSLQGLEVDFVGQLVKHSTPVARGESLFRAGESFTSIYAVCSGSFKLSISDAPDPERVIDFRFPGELLGMGGIHTGRHCGDAWALEDSAVCALPFQQLSEIGAQIPMVQMRIIRLMSEELFHRQRTALLLTGLRKAEERLAAFLLSAMLRFREHGYSAHKFRLVMNREDIGSYLGLAKETVSRVLTGFQRDGVLELRGKQIEAINLDGLVLRSRAPKCVLDPAPPDTSV